MPMLKSSDKGKLEVLENDNASASDLAVSLEFMGIDKNCWKFETSIQNKSGSTIEIQPRNLVCKLNQDTPTLISALTLEGELAHIEKERAKIHRLQAIRLGSQVGELTLDLVGAFIPEQEKPTTEALNAERIEELEQEVSDLKLDQSYEQRLLALESEERFWQSSILKDTKLEPGESMEGFVFYPVQDYEGGLQIFMQFYPYRYVQNFDQSIVNVEM